MYGSSVVVWKAATQLHCDSSRCLAPVGNLLRKPLQILQPGEAPVSLETVGSLSLVQVGSVPDALEVRLWQGRSG